MACTRTSVGVGVVVRSSDGLVLVGRRRAEPGAPLAVPGGKPEPGETIEACAVRELREETGLTVDPARVRTFTAVLAPPGPDGAGWVVAGVEAAVAEPAAAVALQVREPEKFGDFTWIDLLTADLAALYPATAALLARLPGPAGGDDATPSPTRAA